MSRYKEPIIFACDFETSVYQGQTETEVWASGLVQLYTEDVIIHNSLLKTWNYLLSLDTNIILYYHNLKFDGNFWLDFLINKLEYKQAYVRNENNLNSYEFLSEKDMPKRSFKYLISGMGQWYTITIRTNKWLITIKDSLKLLPFSLKRLGEGFKTKHQKLDMNYYGERHEGGEILPHEYEYLKNDLLVLKEGLEIMFNEGHTRLTIGSCCLEEFKKVCVPHKQDYESMFPDLYKIPIDKDTYGTSNAGDYIRRSYKGGWCYLVEGKENQIKTNGCTADVNSLYPSMMSSESGNRYPVGVPQFWSGNYLPDVCYNENYYFFVRIKTRFYIKENYLPFIQIKRNALYKSNECLKTSDIKDFNTGKYCNHYINSSGEKVPARVTMTLTGVDYKLFIEHYNVVDFEILDGCYFRTDIGIFDSYIEKYKKIKQESKGARRELSKLFLNNLYGKMATSPLGDIKIAVVKPDGVIGFIPCIDKEKRSGYIPIGSAITSYARNFTIRHAQLNFYGADKQGFIYADTDSIHCDLPLEQIKGIKIHDTNFCCWKIESQWDTAIFVRQKTYIEHITHNGAIKIDAPYYNVTCAGMPYRSKLLLTESMNGYSPDKEEYYRHECKFDDYDINWIKTKRNINDFKIGFTVHGKLIPKRIKGGVVLQDTTYEMR